MKKSNLTYCSSIAAPCLLASAPFAFGLNYPDFSSTSGLNPVGNAAPLGTAVRLTAATPTQAGALWYTQKQSVINGFDTTFTFRISNPGGPFGGGDGIAFSLQNYTPSSPGWEFGAISNEV